MHPRNKYQGHYNYTELVHVLPELTVHLQKNPSGQWTINYSDPMAVKLLNKAILLADYKIDFWDIPDGYLSPAIPGRAEYVHHVADILAKYNNDKVPLGKSIHLLDIGAGANYIYPIIAASEYQWRVTGTDIDKVAVHSARQIIQKNLHILKDAIMVHHLNPNNILKGICSDTTFYDVVVCNPPFHPSEMEAQKASQRKMRNLKYDSKSSPLNFGGRSNELWCPGGEAAFIKKMITESRAFRHSAFLFTSLISKESNCKNIESYLREDAAVTYDVVNWQHGHKKSRIIVWTYFSDKQIKAWRMRLSMG